MPPAMAFDVDSLQARQQRVALKQRAAKLPAAVRDVTVPVTLCRVALMIHAIVRPPQLFFMHAVGLADAPRPPFHWAPQIVHDCLR